MASYQVQYTNIVFLSKNKRLLYYNNRFLFNSKTAQYLINQAKEGLHILPGSNTDSQILF